MKDFKATDEQRVVLDAELVPLKVVACAGSGKTATAVRRLLEVRRRMGRSRGYAVLLSYSNVAVDTFRQQYALEASKHGDLSHRVLICTVDSFITNNILAPHAAQVMGCMCRPYLAHGRERFLENKAFSVYDGDRPVSIADVDMRSVGGKWNFVNSKTEQVLPDNIALKAINALGRTGAYTHALGRRWALLTLTNTPRIADVLATRFPHILVDEAQDVGSLHGQILRHLADAGTVLALVGDPNQAIFQFADADGTFLKTFAVPGHGVEQPMTENRRSVSQIVDLANSVAGGAKSKPIRVSPERRHGAYYLQYEPSKLGILVTTFSEILTGNKFLPSEAAILARGKTLAFQLGGGKDGFGQGATRLFAEAAVYRDISGDIAKAFERALDGMLRLIDTDDNHLRSAAASGERGTVATTLRRCVWRFLRDSAVGVPCARLPADEWHSALKKRLPAVLSEIRAECGFAIRKSWGMNVTTKELGTAPLFREELVGQKGKDIRVSTVHKVKGESIPAVLYVTNGKSLNSLVAGTVDEEGRIGYVAVTRAGDLLIVAIPRATPLVKVKELKKLGLLEWTD